MRRERARVSKFKLPLYKCKSADGAFPLPVGLCFLNGWTNSRPTFYINPDYCTFTFLKYAHTLCTWVAGNTAKSHLAQIIVFNRSFYLTCAFRCWNSYSAVFFFCFFAWAKSFCTIVFFFVWIFIGRTVSHTTAIAWDISCCKKIR